MRRKKQIWVSENYAKELKADAAKAGKTLIRYTDELARDKKRNGTRATFSDYIGI